MFERPNIQKLKLKRDEKKFKFKTSSLMFALMAFLITCVVFFGLIGLENYFSNQIVYQQVVIAKTEIPDNTIITEDNASQYLEISSVVVTEVTANTLTSADNILNMQAKITIDANSIVTTNEFEDLSVYTENMEDPIQISVDVSDIASADAGKIRAGDLVNLTVMADADSLEGATDSDSSSITIIDSSASAAPTEDDSESTVTDESTTDETSSSEVISDEPVEETDEVAKEYSGITYNSYSQYVMENIYVTAVYDSSGTEIDPTDTESNATIIEFTIEKADEPFFNNMITNFTNIRISKVLVKSEEKTTYTVGEATTSSETDTDETETETSETTDISQW